MKTKLTYLLFLTTLLFASFSYANPTVIDVDEASLKKFPKRFSILPGILSTTLKFQLENFKANKRYTLTVTRIKGQQPFPVTFPNTTKITPKILTAQSKNYNLQMGPHPKPIPFSVSIKSGTEIAITISSSFIGNIEGYDGDLTIPGEIVKCASQMCKNYATDGTFFTTFDGTKKKLEDVPFSERFLDLNGQQFPLAEIVRIGKHLRDNKQPLKFVSNDNEIDVDMASHYSALLKDKIGGPIAQNNKKEIKLIGFKDNVQYTIIVGGNVTLKADKKHRMINPGSVEFAMDDYKNPISIFVIGNGGTSFSIEINASFPSITVPGFKTDKANEFNLRDMQFYMAKSFAKTGILFKIKDREMKLEDIPFWKINLLLNQEKRFGSVSIKSIIERGLRFRKEKNEANEANEANDKQDFNVFLKSMLYS